jgi:type IV pilus assembly protein PilE
MKTQNGFSLVELMIVVVVMGILMAIALPNYSDYVIRGKIPDATSALSTKRVQMEQYFQDNRSYVAGPACNADTTTSQNFDFSCSVAGTATNFTLQAVGKSAMAGFTYRLDESGNKSTAIAAPAPTRWLATSPTAPATTGGCWVTNTGGSC